MSVLGLIPARGGSKGVPRKNVRPLGGLPLIAHTIRAALASERLDAVVVSTDDAEIADVARRFGAEVPFLRPAELAGDTAPTVDVVLHALDTLDRDFDHVVVLQPTAPLRSAEDIDDAVALLLESGADTVFSGYHAGAAHPFYAYRMKAGRPVPLVATEPGLRRQDFPEIVIRNGAIYAVTVAFVRANRMLAGGDCRAQVMPFERSANIDSEDDWRWAEFLLARSQEADGSKTAFHANWVNRTESSYTHWTRDEPRNQIQFAFRRNWQVFEAVIKASLPGRSPADLKVLEVGAGRGTMSLFFADAGFACTLLDYSSEAVRLAEGTFCAAGFEASFTQGDALAMAFANDSFDIVFSIGLLEHFEDIAAVLAEQVRVLRPGGVLLVYVVPEFTANIQKDYDWINRFLAALTAGEVTAPKADTFRSDAMAPDYVAVLRDLGMQNIEATGLFPVPMISPSPEFPFTLNTPDAERVLVETFSRWTDDRTRRMGRDGWLCEPDRGQAFLVTGRKPAP